MNKTIFFITIITISLAQGIQPLKFLYGNLQANLVKSGNSYNGVVKILSNGGLGGYNYFFSGLPPGWTFQSNQITIPNILNVFGSFIIKARVSDSSGSYLQADIRLIVRGLKIMTQQVNAFQGSNKISNIQNTQNASKSSDDNNEPRLTSIFSQNTVNNNTKGNLGGVSNIQNILSNNLRNENTIFQNYKPTINTGDLQSSNVENAAIKTQDKSNSKVEPNIGLSISSIVQSLTPSSIQNKSLKNTIGIQETQINSDLASLYESYPGLPSGITTAELVNGIYSSSSPTGSPSIPNPIPGLISSAQAQFDPSRDSNMITVQEVKRNAAFNRQLYANKAVANLIAIIQQLTANVNSARNDMRILQKQLKDTETSNVQCNNRIYDLSNTRTKIQNAIKDRQDKIADTNQKIENLLPTIKDLNNGRDNLIKKRTQIQNARFPSNARLSDLQRDLKNSTVIKQKLQRQFDTMSQNIDGLNNEIKKTQQDAASAPSAIQLINQQIPIVQNKIDELQKQLRNAQRQKYKLIEDRQTHLQIIQNSKKKVNDIQKSIRQIRDRIPDLQSQITDANNDIDIIQKQIDQFRNQIAQKQVDYRILSDQIVTQQKLIQGKNEQVKKLNQSIFNLPRQIIALQQQHARIQEIVKRQYNICNDVADAVRAAKQNVEAMNNKYNTQSNWLRQANNNLQKARAEKQLADLSIQQIISSSTKALPFPIIPNRNDFSSSNPSVNNQRGSPLSSFADRNLIGPAGPIVIGDLRTYLSQAYGAAVDPTKPSNVTTLYPLSLLTTQALTGQSIYGVFNSDGTFNGVLNGQFGERRSQLSSFTCTQTNGMTQGFGKVISLQPGQIVIIRQNGNSVILKISTCSNLNAIQKNVSIVPKTPVYYKGVQKSPGQVNLQQLTCV